jgi:putative copper export protein
MLWLDLILRWLHILSAVALAGGIFFWRFSLLGAMESLPDETRQAIAAATRSRWSKIVMASSGLLLVTGLVNFMLLVQRFDFDKGAFPGSKYHMLFGIKFLLSLGIFFLSALLTGRTSTAEKLRRSERLWWNVNVVLAIAVVCFGGLLRAAVRHPKAAQSLQPNRPAQDRGAENFASLTSHHTVE